MDAIRICLSRCRAVERRLSDQPFRYLTLDNVADQTPRSLKEGEFVRKDTLQKDTNTEVPSYVCRGDQHYVLGKPKMRQVNGLGQDIEVLRRR